MLPGAKRARLAAIRGNDPLAVGRPRGVDAATRADAGCDHTCDANRYGPDTKAAVVLTGANRLLRDVTAAIASVCRSMADQGTAPEIRLAVSAGLVLETFRGQPALVSAAVQARRSSGRLPRRGGSTCRCPAWPPRRAASSAPPESPDVTRTTKRPRTTRSGRPGSS